MNLYWPEHPFRSDKRSAKRRQKKWAGAERAAKTHLVISHGGCLDGTGAAIIARRVWGEGVATSFVQPNQMADVLGFYSNTPGRGRHMAIADLSLQPEQYDAIVAACAKIKQNGWTLSWRDHHHKQWEGLDLTRLQQHLEVLEVNKDATESGASLMQKALAPNDKFLADLADVIRDRDLWWNKTKDSETMEFALSELGAKDFTNHFLTATGPVVGPFIADAAQREKDGQVQIRDTLLARAVHLGEGSKKVSIVYGWLPKNTGLHELIEGGAAVAINVRPNGKMSLRSRKDTPVCHLIAKQFGGGGHPNASGGDLKLKGVRYWWYVVRRGNVAITQQVGAAAQKVLAEA